MDHRKLSTHLIRRHGHVSTNLLRIADDIEVRARRLHHDNVRALVDISAYGAAGESPPTRRQLVTFAVAERGTRPGSVAEGAVQAAGELGGIAHQQRLVRDTRFDQLQLDSSHAPVVHVARRDAVCTRLGVRHGDVADAVDGEAVVQTAVIAQYPAVPVAGVFAEADVGDDEQAGKAGFDQLDGLDDGAVGVVGGGAEGVFRAGLEGHAEEDDGAETFADEGGEVAGEFVEAAAVLVGEGGDEGLFVGVIGDEEGVDEHGLALVLDVSGFCIS
ncbi:hypothetical protein MMC06_006792 [Schaereria dolodes]|nr:hypothetical protein [Schaereria dolodes]